MRKTHISLFILLTANSAIAQNFKYKTKINTVETNGFYKIELSPQIIARSKYSLADLRIIAEDGTEIPYIINNEVASFYEKDFIPFPINENSSKGNTQTLIIGNVNHQAINNLVIEMKNAYGEKKIRISGSDDKKNWYMLHQGFTFTVPGDENNTMVYKAIDFPMANYTWFSIALIDTMPLSLNILRVGNYTQKVIFGKYSTLLRTLFYQRDSSDKKSYVKILLEEPNLVDILKINVEKPEQYLRYGNLYMKYLGMDTVNGYKEITSRSYSNEYPSQSITLNSDVENAFTITDGRKIINMFLVIENKDNQPLKIESIELQQLKTYLSARLEKGKTYFLQFGDSTLEEAQYDLKYFENKIPKNIPIINHLGIQSNHPNQHALKENKNYNRLFIWLALGLAGIVLAFMTTKMVKEIKNKPS